MFVSRVAVRVIPDWGKKFRGEDRAVPAGRVVAAYLRCRKLKRLIELGCLSRFPFTRSQQPGKADQREIAPLRHLQTPGPELLFPTRAVAAPAAGDVAG